MWSGYILFYKYKSVNDMSNISMIALTDFDWYSFLNNSNINNQVNFWTPTPWNVKKMEVGDKVYFLLKKKYGRKICGFGSFVKYETKDISGAWSEYGLGNGVQNLDELRYRVQKYTDKNSKTGYKGNNHIIGCLILNKICFLPEDEQKPPDYYGWNIPINVVKYKYINDTNFNVYTGNEKSSNNFYLVDKSKSGYILNKCKERKGQSKFRTDLMMAYNYRCCITGESTSETLQAAHIQEYISKESNNIQNGILLRIDLHMLFDAGLITLNENFEVCISPHLTSKNYTQYSGKKISLPTKKYWPSKEAIKWHNENVFRK